jgi:CBS domain-containing protein
MLVKDLMTTDVVTVPQDATLRAAAERLLTEDVGSVIVVDEETNLAGMVTETDTLRAAYETDAPLSEIAVADLSHPAVVTTTPDRTIQHVARTMADEGVKKVPVVDGIDLVGMITLTDIVWELSDIRKEAVELAEMADHWDPNA